MQEKGESLVSTQENGPKPILNRADFIYLEAAHVGNKVSFTNGFTRNKFGTQDILINMRQERKNIGLYRSAFMYDNKDPYEANLFGDLFLDFDCEEDIDKAREDLLFVVWKLHLAVGFNLPMEAFHIYFSGKKGFHLLIPWQYLDIKPHQDLDKIFRWIAEDLYEQSINKTIDLVIYEKRRLYRLENSIHQETNLYKIPLQYLEAVNFSVEELQQLATKNRYIQYAQPVFVPQAAKQYEKYITDFDEFVKKQKVYSSNVKRTKIDYIPDYVQKLIDDGPVKGQRNETVAALTSFWNNQELEEDEIFEKLKEWNDGELPERELKTTMRSILKRNLNYGLSRLKSLSDGELETDRFTRDKFKRKGD